MPDISMCKGEGCIRKDTCYRYRAVANPQWQSYFTAPPVKEDGSCEYYWKMNHREEESSNGAHGR